MCNYSSVIRNEGYDEGISVGENRANEKLARRMIRAEEPIDKIAEYTGLTKEQVEKLREEELATV